MRRFRQVQYSIRQIPNDLIRLRDNADTAAAIETQSLPIAPTRDSQGDGRRLWACAGGHPGRVGRGRAGLRSPPDGRRLGLAACRKGVAHETSPRLSRRSGLPAKTIRYYEEIGLVRPARRTNGYRAFDARDLRTLAFLSRARSLGFSIEECRVLLRSLRGPGRASADVKSLVAEHLAGSTRRCGNCPRCETTLSTLAASCAGDNRPDCPILQDLARRSA